MVLVYEGRMWWLASVERPIYRALRVDPEAEQSWQRYAGALIVFSGVAILITYLIIRLQGHLPLNPQHQNAVPAGLAFNTAVPFGTHTHRPNYPGASTT